MRRIRPAIPIFNTCIAGMFASIPGRTRMLKGDDHVIASSSNTDPALRNMLLRHNWTGGVYCLSMVCSDSSLLEVDEALVKMLDSHPCFEEAVVLCFGTMVTISLECMNAPFCAEFFIDTDDAGIQFRIVGTGNK